MTDTKPPTAEHIERAQAFLRERFRITSGDSKALAAEFQASDAIARRMAIEEALDAIAGCMPVGQSAIGPLHFAGWSTGVELARERVLALLRAPTSEQTSGAVRSAGDSCLPAGGGPEEPALTTPTSEKAACWRCDGTGQVFVYISGPREDPDVRYDPCPACSPPADGGGQ